MTPTVQPEVRARSTTGYTGLWLFGLLVLVCYAPAIKSLVVDWMTDDNMGHGFFVPLVVGYIVWQERDALKRLPMHPNWWGLAVVAAGAAQSLVGTLGVEMFLARSALIVTLAGVVWGVGGTAWLKKLSFPYCCFVSWCRCRR